MIEINIASIIGTLMTGLVLLGIKKIVDRLDHMNGSIAETRGDLQEHKIEVMEKFVPRAECREHRQECHRIGD